MENLNAKATQAQERHEAGVMLGAMDRVAALKAELAEAEGQLIDASNAAGYNNGHPRARYYRVLNHLDAMRAARVA